MKKIDTDKLGGAILIAMIIVIIIACQVYTDRLVKATMNQPDFDKQQCEHLSSRHVYHNGNCEYIPEN